MEVRNHKLIKVGLWRVLKSIVMCTFVCEEMQQFKIFASDKLWSKIGNTENKGNTNKRVTFYYVCGDMLKYVIQMTTTSSGYVIQLAKIILLMAFLCVFISEWFIIRNKNECHKMKYTYFVN